MPPLRQSSLLIYLIVLLGFVVGFLYNSQVDPTANVAPIDAKFQLTSLRELEHLKLDDSILQSNLFRSLRIFGQMPVQTSGGGKSNPFQ